MDSRLDASVSSHGPTFVCYHSTRTRQIHMEPIRKSSDLTALLTSKTPIAGLLMSNNISVSIQEQVKTIIQLKNFDVYETLPFAQAVPTSKSLLFDHCFIHIVKLHLSPECMSQPLRVSQISSSACFISHVPPVHHVREDLLAV